ncbi:MAG TPA: hypothetical protein VFX30_05075 [bacterium]|nr:hypothetical protein [bacterium]
MPDRSTWLRILLLLAALAAAAYALFTLLQRDAYLRGTDAYYYALQIDHWARTGHARIPDSAWIFPLLGLIQRAGLTTEAVLRGLCAASLFLGALAVAWGEPGASRFRRSVAALWFVLSPTMLFTAVEFPKMFLVAALLPLWDFTRDRRRFLVSAAAMILAIWAHRSSSVLLVAFSLGWWLDRRTGRESFLKSARIVLAVLAALAVLGFVLGDRSLFVDVNRFLPAATLSEPGLFSLISRDSLPVALKAELILAAVIFLFLLLQRAFRRDSKVPFRYAIPGLLAFLPWGSEDVFSVGERLALFLPLLTLLMWSRSRPNEAGERLSAGAAVLGGFLSLFAGTRLELSHPLTLDPDVAALARETASVADRGIPMLITHKTLAYYYKYAARAEAFPYEPEDHWNKERIWRLAYGIRPDEIWTYLSPECRDRLEFGRKDYLLVREDCWEDARRKLVREEDSDLYDRAWNPVWNPSKKRPAFLYPKHENDQDGEDEEFPALPPKGGTQ